MLYVLLSLKHPVNLEYALSFIKAINTLGSFSKGLEWNAITIFSQLSKVSMLASKRKTALVFPPSTVTFISLSKSTEQELKKDFSLFPKSNHFSRQNSLEVSTQKTVTTRINSQGDVNDACCSF